jgi:hypothetical protein
VQLDGKFVLSIEDDLPGTPSNTPDSSRSDRAWDLNSNAAAALDALSTGGLGCFLRQALATPHPGPSGAAFTRRVSPNDPATQREQI